MRPNVSPSARVQLNHGLRDGQNVCALTKVGTVLDSWTKMENAVVSETCCLSAGCLMFLEVGTRVGNEVSFRISLSKQPVAYTAPGTMGQRSLARNSSGANEGLEGTPYNAQYGETPLKKRKRKGIGKEKGRNNCHAF